MHNLNAARATLRGKRSSDKPTHEPTNLPGGIQRNHLKSSAMFRCLIDTRMMRSCVTAVTRPLPRALCLSSVVPSRHFTAAVAAPSVLDAATAHSAVPLTGDDVVAAHKLLSSYPLLYRTPTFECYALNKMLNGHRLFFKAENLQRAGAFKARGALHTVLKLVQRWQAEGRNRATLKVIAFSSGNHAQAVAWACASVTPPIPCTIFMAANCSPVKVAGTRAQGAEVVLAESRLQAESLAAERVDAGAELIHPFAGDDVIAGQGTAVLESLQDLQRFQRVLPDAVFTPVGRSCKTLSPM